MLRKVKFRLGYRLPYGYWSFRYLRCAHSDHVSIVSMRKIVPTVLMTVFMIASAGESAEQAAVQFTSDVITDVTTYLTTDVSASDYDMMIANAAGAYIASPQQVTIADHYGDPSRFVKYIIRRPPVHS